LAGLPIAGYEFARLGKTAKEPRKNRSAQVGMRAWLPVRKPMVTCKFIPAG